MSLVFLGVDAAWGPVHETGVVALEPNGKVLDAGWTVGLQETVDWIATRAGSDAVVFVDAPLLVTNAEGQRLCEKQVGQQYWRWKVSANSTNLSKSLEGVAMRELLVAEHGFRYDDGCDGPPPARPGRVLSECYPYTTIVGYEPFGYDVERPTYKRRPKGARSWPELRARVCDELIANVAQLKSADPPMDLRSHPLTRKLVEEPSPLAGKAYKHREDLLDAALCAWTASLWHRHGLAACQVLGHESDGARPAATIIAPARPSQR